MTNQEAEHNLAVLVELQLFPLIRVLKEEKIKDVDMQEIIGRFIKELPPYLSEIPEAENIVRKVLEKTERDDEERKKLKIEHDREISEKMRKSDKRELGEER